MKFPGLIILILVLSIACISQTVKCDEQTGFVLNSEKPSVYIEFEQFGKADDWGNARLAEINIKPAIKKGNDVWLRLYNNSCWDISFRTLSMYMSKVPDPSNPGKFKIVFGYIQDDSAANVAYVAEEQDRKHVPWGGDSFSISRLASGHSLVFPIYRDHLEKDRSIFVDFNYGWEKDKWSYNLAPEHRAFFWGYRLEEVKKKK